MTDARTAKRELRIASLQRRDALTAEERSKRSLAIAEIGDSHILPAPGAMASGFFPIRSEPDMRPLMDRLRQKGFDLSLPVVLNRSVIVFRKFAVGDVLIDAGLGTRGPAKNAAVVDPDLILMPLAAFDAEGNRIGYGAGHYDRAIAQMHEKGLYPKRIGIAFDCQEVAEVPFEPHDMRLDAIVTESGYRQFS